MKCQCGHDLQPHQTYVKPEHPFNATGSECGYCDCKVIRPEHREPKQRPKKLRIETQEEEYVCINIPTATDPQHMALISAKEVDRPAVSTWLVPEQARELAQWFTAYADWAEEQK